MLVLLLHSIVRSMVQIATILSVTKWTKRANIPTPSRRAYFSHTSHFSLLQPCRKHQKYVAQIMLASYLSMPGVLLAQGVTAANTAHAPSFDSAANGVPIVNINAPSVKGVSRNEYNDLNVGYQGLIFNNATDIVNTQLAGYVDGNSNLNGNSANIILNEVKGNSRSALNGFMEIAGKRAELIIANQNGITCNGCGFINTSRGTLTTGQATFDGAGGLTGFDVSRGDIDLTGLGFNATNLDEVDILARSVSLNGKFWANNATIVTGQNHISYQDKKVQDKNVTADAGSTGSGFSLDVAAIGGMYANRIRLIGTEKGLGVNIAGEMKAVEDMVLDSQGNILNSGTVSAKSITVSSKGLSNMGSVLGKNIHISTDQLDNATALASIQATENISIVSTQALSNRDGAKILTKNGLIKMDAGAVSNQSLIAADRIDIKASSLENNTIDGQIVSTDELDLTLTGNLSNINSGSIHSDKVLSIDTLGNIINTNATIEAVNTASVTAKELTNSGTLSAQNSALTINMDKVDNQGTLSGNGIVITAAELNNSTENGKILSADTLDLTLTGNANNTDGGLIHSDKAFTLNAIGDLVNTDSTIETIESANINSQNLTNSGTILAQNGTLTVETNKLENQGSLSGNSIIINADELSNSTENGKILSSNNLDLTLTGNANNTDGALVHADIDLILDVKGNLTNSGTIEAVGSTGINSENLTNSGTVLAQDSGLSIDTNKIDNQGTLSGNGVVITAAELNNSTENGKILSADTLDLTLTGNANNTDGGLIHSDKAFTLNASGDLVNTDSTIEAVESANINSQNLTNSGTVLAQDSALTINTNKIDNQGTLSGNGVVITAAELNNSTKNGKILSADTLELTLAGNANNTDGALVHADTDLTLDAKGNLTNSATIEAVGSTEINSQNLTNSGTVLAQNNALSIDTNKVENQGTLSGNGLVIHAAELDNKTNTAQIVSSDKIDLTIQGDITNTDGALVHTDTDLTLNAKGNATNSGTIEAVESSSITTKSLTNLGTILAQDSGLSIETHKLKNQGMLSGNGVVITAAELNNSTENGKILSSDTLDLIIDSNIANTDGGLIHAGKALVINAEGDLNNSESIIETLTSAWVKVQNLFNTGTILAQDESLSVETTTVNNQGTLSGNGLVIHAVELGNKTSTAQIVSSEKIDLIIQGDITNTDGALVHADTDLTLDAKGNLTNSATIEAVGSTGINSENLTNSGTVLAQDSGLSIDTNKIDNQGTLSGNGVVITAAELNNSTENGKILSADTLDLTLAGNANNTDGALVHADTDLTLDAKGNLTNSATIEAVKSTMIKSQNLTNSGTVLAQDSALTINTNKIDNQGTLSGNGVVITAAELNNGTENGKILSSNNLDLTIVGNVANTDGALVHADTDLTLDAKGNATNSGTIEAVESSSITTKSLTNSGTILAQDSGLSIETHKLKNQGTLSGNGVVITVAELNNSTKNGKILSADTLDLTIDSNIANTDGGLIHADKALVINAKGDLNNSESIIETLTSAWVKVQNFFNTGTVLAQDESLSIEAMAVENQGTLSGNGLIIHATELDNTTSTAQIVSSDKIDLTLQGNITNTDGTLVHADTDLTLDAKGNLTNSGTIEAVKSTMIKSQNLTNSGTVLAQDSALTINTNKIDNQGTLSGNGVVITATELNNSTGNGKLLSSGTLNLTLSGNANNINGGLIHADTDLTLNAKGNVTNSGTIEAVKSTTVKSQNLTNSGTVLAQESGLSIETNKLDNQGTLSSKGVVINSTALDNSTVNGKILSSEALDLTIEGDISNSDGALIHADKALSINAKGDLSNSESIIETLTAAWTKVQNLFNTGTILAQDESLSVETTTVNNQGTLSGNGLVIHAAELDNKTNTAQIVSSEKIDLTIQGDITNTDGALVHADTDLTLDAKGNLTNSGTIEAVESATVKSENLTNSGTVLAQNGALTVDTNQVENQGVLAGNGITINAALLDNKTTNAKIFSSDKVDLNVTGDINNTNGALVHAGTDVNLDAKGNLTNSGTIEAVTSVWAEVKNLFNTGTVLAQDGSLFIEAVGVDNQGVLAGNGITINVNGLSNSTANAKIFSSDNVDLTIQGNMINTAGALVHAGSDVNLNAKGNVTNSGTIEAVTSVWAKVKKLFNTGTLLAQNSALSIDTNKVDNQGVLAGNGITINAASLDNKTTNAKIFSSDKVHLTIDGDLNNMDGALVHAGTDVNLEVKGNVTNSGTIEAVESAMVNSQNLTNSGTVLAQNSTLKVDINQLDNQGVLAGNGITINATSLDNDTNTAQIFSSDKVDLTIDGDFNNTDSALVHAGSDVNLDAKGNLTNSGTIEAVESAAVKSENLTNSGTVLAQNSTLKVDANQLDNQGVLAGKGITINANDLSNSAASAKIFSSDKVDLTVEGNITNTDGALVHAATDVTLDAKGNVTNSGMIEAVSAVWSKVQNLFNTGTVLAQDDRLSIEAVVVENQGVLAGKGIKINANELSNSTANAKIFSSDNVDLIINGDITNTNSALVHAATNVNLDTKGNLINNATIEAVELATIKSQNLTNSGTVLAQNSTLTINTNQVDNQGVLAGNGITINAASLDNKTTNAKIFSSDKVDLTIDGNITNTDGALVHAGTDVNLDAKGNLTNTNATIGAVGSTEINSQNLTNSGTVLAQNNALSIDTNKVENQGVLAGNGITINANDLSNSTASAKIFSSDKVDLTIAGDITNTDGALVHAGTDVNLDAKGNLNNTGSVIEAVSAVWSKVQNLFNTGTVLAQNGALTVDTNQVENQGVLAGNGITINANDLSNSTASAKIFSSDKVDLTIAGDITNTDGALVHAGTDVNLDAKGNLTNTNATIEAVGSTEIKSQNFTNSGTVLAQNGALTLDTNQVENQGVLAGNSITINAAALDNKTAKAKIFSSDNVDLTIAGNISNSDGALIHSNNALVVNAKGDLSNSESIIETLSTAWVKVQNLFNSGTILARDGSLSVETATADNQGTLSGNGIVINAATFENSTESGKIFSSDNIDLTVEGDITNTDGALVHAETDVALDAKGNLINNATIETVESATVNSQNLTNSGTILAQNGTLTVDSNQLDNQGMLSGNGITLEVARLNNLSSNAKVFSTGGLVLNAEETVENKEGGLLHAANALDITSVGNVSNVQSTIESAGSINLNSLNLYNSANSKVLAKNGGLTLQTNTLNNQGSLSGHGLDATAALILNNTATSKILSTNDLTLTTQDSFSNLNGAQVKANNTLTINTKGDLNNTGSILESVNNIILNSRNLNNANTGTISAQNGTLSITNTGSLNNQAGIAGNRVIVNSADVVNTGNRALILGRNYLNISSASNITNQDGAVLYSLWDGVLNVAGTLLNSSAIIETRRNLAITANQITNKKRTYSASQHVTSNSYSNVGIGVPSGYYAATRNYTETITTPYIVSDSPQAYILSGANMSIMGKIDNIYSTISAVGNLNFVAGKVNNVSYSAAATNVKSGTDYLHRAWETCSRKWYRKKRCSMNYATDTRGYNNTTSSTVHFASATFTAGGNITGRAGSVSNVGNVADVVASNVETKALKEIEGSASINVSGQAVLNTATGTTNVKASGADGVQVAVASTANATLSGQAVVNTATGTTNAKASNADGVQVGVKETSANTSVSGQAVANAVSGSINVKVSDAIQVAAKETSANTSVSGQTVVNKATGTTNVKATDGVQVTVTETSANTSVSGQTVVNTATGTTLTKEKLKASGADGVQVAIKEASVNTTLSGQAITNTTLANTATVNTSTNLKEKVPTPVLTTIDLDVVKARRDEIFDDNLVNDIVASALFKESDSPEQNYLIETNPLLTNYKSFISSDYMLNKMIGDESGRTGKAASRLGDGYLEQKLVRDQILSYTGFQTLPNDVDIEATYATLMDNAVDEYKDLGLSTGVELTKEQVSQLKKPIVWMVAETVQTASGPQLALVPKVYFSNASDMTLRSDGSLIAATNIDIDAQDGIANSGSMLATVDLSLKGSSIGNDGTMQAGGNASLNASGDITNSGSLQAGGTLELVAGGNITSETKTQVLTHQRGNHSATETLVGTTATLKGDNISLSAGNNITLKGTAVSAAEQIFASAGNNFTLASLAVTNSSKDGNYYDSSSTTQQVSSVSGKDIQLSAGNKLTSQGAQINATDNLELSAKNIDLLAVKDINDNYSFLDGGGNSTKTRTHDEAITGTELNSGGTLSLVSQEDIFSKGSTLNGGTGIALAAGGDVILATETAQNTNFQEIKTRSSGFWGTKTSTETTTSESLTNQGTSLTSGGDIQMVSGSDIVLSGTKASAAGDIGLQAVGGIQLLSAVDQTSSQYQEQKKGTFKVKAKDQGSIKQTAVTSELAGANISLTSGSNIVLQGATLTANNTLSMGAATGTLQAVTQDTDGHYVNANGEQVGNVTVGTQALQSSEWSKSSSGFRGIFKDLVKIVAVGVAVGTGGLVHGEIKVGEADSTRTDTLIQQISTLAGNDLVIKAKDTLALIGAKISATNLASLSANDIIIDAAHEQTVVSNSHTEQTVSGKGATLQKDQISLASITETDQTERTTTTANTWQGSNISAGSLNLSANNNLAILASDINVDNNADIKAENILVGGRDATTDTTHDSITKTKTLTVGVKNAYVDVALATEALKDAKDAVSDAKNAYDDAKQKVAEGKLHASDLDFYENKLDSAKKSEKLASLAVVNAGVTAALSSATAGFTATAGASTQVTTNTTTATQSNWNGSTINVGNNASLNGQNNLTVEGSAITAQGTLEANAKNIDILAGKNTYAETTSSQTKGASASVTASLGGGVSGSVGINTSKSNSEGQSTQYSNSRLSAGTLKSNSDQLSIQGGNLSGDEVVINTNNLDVVSQQATSTSHSESQGKGINLGRSANSDSVSVSYNQSQTDSDYASVTQQSSITAGDKGYQINVAGNTNLVGGLITSTDKAEASGNNAFSTGTLTQKDLANHAVYSGSSMGVDVGISSTTDSDGNSGLGFSNSMGQGSAGDSRQSTTQSGINTANLAITDADKQQQLTGKSVSQTLADAHTTTSTDTADINSGALKNTFNQAEVEQEINNQREVTQAFSKNVQEVKGAITNAINKQKDELNAQLKNGKISQTEYDQQTATLDNYSLLANTISAGLSVPTDSLAGQVAAAASPAVANQIGQYFKGLAADNENGQLNAGQETAHVLAHGILAAAVASAGGNDATTAGIAAAGSEAAAPVLAKWLYDKDSSDDLTADEKETLSSILSLTSTAVGATTGNMSDAVTAGLASENAVENNFYMGSLNMNPFDAPDAVDRAWVQPVKRTTHNVKEIIRNTDPGNVAGFVDNAASVSILVYPPSAPIAGSVGFLAGLFKSYWEDDYTNMIPGAAGSAVGKTLKYTGPFRKSFIERTSTLSSMETQNLMEK